MAKNKPTTNKSKKNETKVTVKSAKTEEIETVAEKEMDEQKVEAVEEVNETVTEAPAEAEEVSEAETAENDDTDSAEEESEEAETAEAEEVEEIKAEDITEEEVAEAEKIIAEAEAEGSALETSDERGFFKTIFAKKCDASENILTIFHQKKIYGALIGEAFGTFIITLVLLTLGVYQPLYIFFVFLGVSGATYALSGANCNPLITVGMMASRRMSGIRGVLYILAQIFGAWLAYVICMAFVNAGEGLAALPAMATVETSAFWTVTLIEFMCSLILAFFFARAIKGKKNALKFAGVYAGGAVAAFIIAIVISGNFLGLQNNFMMNPAIALMYQILPAGGDDIVELLSDIGLALTTYMVFPMIAGWLGFLISDIADYFLGETCECESECKCCEK